MKLIVGLGNQGKKYKNTRHNVGTWLIEQLTIQQFNNSTIFAKPTVFMNESGKFVKKLVDRYKVPLDELLIIHDDLDVSLGDFRLQKGRGAAGHKGVQSVIDELGSKNFWRLRIGIGRPPEGIEPEDYVLEKFSAKEEEQILGLTMFIKEELMEWVKN